MKHLVRQFKQGDETRCSYRCPFYMDGSVNSYCKKYGQIPQYDGNIPPLRVPKCVADLSNVGLDAHENQNGDQR